MCWRSLGHRYSRRCHGSCSSRLCLLALRLFRRFSLSEQLCLLRLLLLRGERLLLLNLVCFRLGLLLFRLFGLGALLLLVSVLVFRYRGLYGGTIEVPATRRSASVPTLPQVWADNIHMMRCAALPPQLFAFWLGEAHRERPWHKSVQPRRQKRRWVRSEIVPWLRLGCLGRRSRRLGLLRFGLG